MNPEEFRHALSHFATGVTVVTSVGQGGEPVGTTASAVASLSLDPPLVLVCLARASATLASLRSHGAFAINVLAATQRELSSHFARSGSLVSWDAVAHRSSPRHLPLLDGVLAVVECTLERCVTAGDHEIVIGRLLSTDLAGTELDPLLHYRGTYAALAA